MERCHCRIRSLHTNLIRTACWLEQPCRYTLLEFDTRNTLGATLCANEVSWELRVQSTVRHHMQWPELFWAVGSKHAIWWL